MMMKIMKKKEIDIKIVASAPIIMLGVTAIISILSALEIYPIVIKYLSDMLGYSILTNYVMLFYAKRFRYCIANKSALYTLITLNIVNILYELLGVDYYFYSQLFNYIALSIGLLLTIVLTYILKNKNKNGNPKYS